MQQVRIGANPIIWSNDDFQDLGGDIPLERCLLEMQQAGYAGTELGHKFPREAQALSALLQQFDLQLVSGWHSTEILDGHVDDERRRFLQHVAFLQQLGSNVVIVAECSRRTYTDPTVPLQWDERHTLLRGADWDRLCGCLDAFAEMAAARGMTLAYHHHMGTVVQDRDEIDRLMAGTQAIRLLADTGHLAFAGVDPARVFADHGERIAHVHLKDVRADVVARCRTSRASFATAVRSGVFTVPGDGDIDYAPVFAELQSRPYAGWLVVEAEQDPNLAPPLLYAARGRDYLRRSLGI